MTDEYEYTRDLDLLGDWLDAKGYGEEAGLITRSMDYMHKQAARIAELEALLSQTNEGYAECIATREDYRARIAELEAALKPFADAADDLDETPHGQIIFDPDDLRAARAALEKKDD
jgi:hypothetical protein